MLSGQQAFEAGYIAPPDETLVQPASIDVRLDRFVLMPRYNGFVDPADPTLRYTSIDLVDAERITGVPFSLPAGMFALASTYEEVSLPNDIAARFEGKSSLGRLGLGVHVTAGFIDPGFSGQITIELSNVAQAPIYLYPGMKIGQICFFQLNEPAKVPYGQAGNNYQNQRGPTPYRVSKDFRKALPSEDNIYV